MKRSYLVTASLTYRVTIDDQDSATAQQETAMHKVRTLILDHTGGLQSPDPAVRYLFSGYSHEVLRDEVPHE